MTREVEIIVGVRRVEDQKTGRKEDKKVYFLPWDQEGEKSLLVGIGPEEHLLVHSANFLKILKQENNSSLIAIMNAGFGLYDHSTLSRQREFPFVSSIDNDLGDESKELFKNTALAGSVQQLGETVFLGLYLKGDKKNEGLALVRFNDFFQDFEKRETHRLKVTVPLCQYQNDLIVCEDTVAYRCPPDLSEQKQFLKTESPLIAAASLEDLLCFTTQDGRYHVFKDGEQISTDWHPYRLGEPRSLWGVARSMAIHKDPKTDDYYLFFGVYGEIKTMKVSAERQVEFVRQLSFYKKPFFTEQDKDEYREGKIRNMKVTSSGYLVFTLENAVFKVDLQYLTDPTPLEENYTLRCWHKKLSGSLISLEVREED